MKNLSISRRNLLGYIGLGTIATLGTIGNSPYKANIIAMNSNYSLPELEGISKWFNSPPLTIRQLRGKVVLVHFWTFSCINCQRTLPYVVNWHERYKSQGLTVIGVHTPEFAFERDANNIKNALEQWKMGYAVAVDNEYKTWQAYNNRYWPNIFLGDRQGILQYQHAGEGSYDTTELTIHKLLGKV